MELVLIKPTSKEWEYMWEWLANHPINDDVAEPMIAENEGEAWQYMGSLMSNDKVIHQFRHRNHPYNNSVKSLLLNASKDFTPDDIDRSYKL